MRKRRRVTVIGLFSLLAAGVATLIVSDVDFRATPPAAAPRPPADILPAQWHDEPRPAPELAWVDAAGEPARLADLAGRPALLNLWATWCAPCVREMPMLDALAGASGGAFSVVALNQDRDAAAARRFWREGGFAHMALWLDPGLAAFGALEVRGLPLTLILDAEGREIGRVEGVAEWTAPAVAAWLAGGGR